MSARITVAQVNARVDALAQAQDTTNQLLAQLVAQVSAYSSPAPVVTAITSAPSARKAAKATVRKAAKKATPVVAVVTLDEAQALVDGGADAWKVRVASSTTGQPIPFAKVQRAIAAQARTPKAATATAKTTKAVKAVGTKASAYFAMSRAQLDADGSKGAKAEIARREAKRTTAKSA